jgi:hypothetical protein
MNKSVIITFDYEVFLGSYTGTIENSVIKPTQKILKILGENNAKAIFFVDCAWLLFLKDNYPDDFRKIVNQLTLIKKSGSSVELHLHPQWIKAEKTRDGIFFGSEIETYKLHSLNNKEITDLFTRSSELLESITHTPFCCFRAGGWCIEPFNLLRDVFETYNIKYDFSVAPGLFLREGKMYDFDFINAPRLPFYRFENDILNPEKKGQFLEVPVSTYLNNPFYRLTNKLLLKVKNDKIFGDGKGIKEKPFISLRSLRQHIRFSNAMLSLDKTYNLFFRYLLFMHFNKSGLLVIVSHPKTISEQALKNLTYITKKYNTLNSTDLEEQLCIS